MWISKRNESHIITHIQERWETFNQMSMVQNKVVDIDAIDIQSVKINMNNCIYSTYRKYNNSGYKIIRMKYNDETKKQTGKGDKVTDYYQDKKEEEVNQILREQLDKLGMTLRSGKIPGYRIISRSKHNMLIQLQIKTEEARTGW